MRQIIQDSLAIDSTTVAWSYEYEKENGGVGVHTLDARIDVAHLLGDGAAERVLDWARRAGAFLSLPAERTAALRGVVLEVRQGYKSADSKRQNADLRFALRAYNENYLPVLAIVSTQVSAPVCQRYRSAQLLVLLGTLRGGDLESTFAFFQSVVGYDLAAFFVRNSASLRAEFTAIVDVLLQPWPGSAA